MRTIIAVQTIIILTLLALLTATVEYDTILLEPVEVYGTTIYPT